MTLCTFNRPVGLVIGTCGISFFSLEQDLDRLNVCSLEMIDNNEPKLYFCCLISNRRLFIIKRYCDTWCLEINAKVLFFCSSFFSALTHVVEADSLAVSQSHDSI